MQYGTKFRYPIRNRIKYTIKHVANSLDNFIYKNKIKHNLSIDFLNEWKFFVINNFKT